MSTQNESVNKPVPSVNLGPGTLALYGLVLCAGIVVAAACFKFFLKSPPARQKVLAVAARPQPPATHKLLVPAPLSPASTPASETAPQEESLRGAVEIPALVLSGVFTSAQGCFAILNNQVVKVGDSIEGVQLTGVTASEALFELKGRKFKISTRKK